MDDRMNLQGGPPPGYGTPYQQAYPEYAMVTPPGKSKAWIWIAAAVAVVACIVLALVFFVFGGQAGMRGNTGVVAVYEYFSQDQQNTQKLMGPVQQELSERAFADAFEMDSEIDVKSDAFRALGAPFESLTLDLSAKYDKKDLGVKLSALGGIMDFGAYLIGDDLVITGMGEAAGVPIDLPIKADLDDPMPLKERALAFLPFLPDEDDDLLLRLYEAFAMSVPEEYTETDTDDVYSPMADDEVEMTVITTTLDSDALEVVAKNFVEILEEDDALYDGMQDLLDDISDYFDVDLDLDEMLDGIAGAQYEDLAGVEISWSVYKKGGAYVGVSFRMERPDMEMTQSIMTEYSGNKCYSSVSTALDSVEIQNVMYETTFDKDRIELSGQMEMSNAYGLSATTPAEMKIEAEAEYEKVTSDKIGVRTDATLEAKNMGNTAVAQDIKIDIGMDMEWRFGDGLDMLEDNRDWSEVYEMEWGDIDDLMYAMSSLGMIF